MVSRAEDQLLRGHVTDALFTLRLDTPVRHCVKGLKIIKAGRSCKESGRGNAPRARPEYLQCNKNTAHTQLMNVTTITKLYHHLYTLSLRSMLHRCVVDHSRKLVRGRRMIGCRAPGLFEQHLTASQPPLFAPLKSLKIAATRLPTGQDKAKQSYPDPALCANWSVTLHMICGRGDAFHMAFLIRRQSQKRLAFNAPSTSSILAAGSGPSA